MLELPTARGPANRVVLQRLPTRRPKDGGSTDRPTSVLQPLLNTITDYYGSLRRSGPEDSVARDVRPEYDHERSSASSESDFSSIRSESEASLTLSPNTPVTTPSTSPASACLNLPPIIEDVAIASASGEPNSSPPPITVSNTSGTPLAEGPLVITVFPPSSLSELDHIESILESSEFRSLAKNSMSQRAIGTSTRRGPFTARGNYIGSCLTRERRIKALYSIVAWVQMEDGTFKAFQGGLDLGSPWTWLYFERWKDSEQEVDTLEYNDESKIKVAAVNSLTLKFHFQSAPTTYGATTVFSREENLEVEVAESGTQDTAAFTRRTAQGPHGLFGLAPANVAYYHNVGERQTILKSMYVEDFANMRGISGASRKFGFMTLRLREEFGFVKFGEPETDVTWFSTKLTSDWSLLLDIDVTTAGAHLPVKYPSAHLLVDCGQSITTGPPIFVEEIYNLLGIRWKKEPRWVIRQPGAPPRWWTGYYIAQQDVTQDADITFRDPDNGHQVSFSLPPKFWNTGPTVTIAGESWRFGPLQTEESDIVLGWNVLEFLDVHLKSNFDKDKHHIGFTQNFSEFA